MSSPLLAHRVDGEGAPGRPPLLLLNGGFMSMASWEPLAAPLAERHRVVRCDLRGQLLSPGPPHRDLAANVDDVAALIDHLGIDRVDVLGTSFGGEVGLLLAARRPERVARLVVVTASDHATESMRQGAHELRAVVAEVLAGGDRGRFHDALVAAVYSPAFAEQNAGVLAARRLQLGALPDAWFAAADGLVAAVEDFDLRPELGAIRCPALVVVAADDRVMPPERGRALAAAIPGARLAEHPTSGHALVAEQPAWLVEEVVGFLESLDGGTGGHGGPPLRLPPDREADAEEAEHRTGGPLQSLEDPGPGRRGGPLQSLEDPGQGRRGGPLRPPGAGGT
ncbi:MAG TPA: alpha/beta fold hydrolase [Thermoanaerobaculia bacterium]|nr:alpha/beta fold hydrolase [Thermoanaerobaculia bacterium]